MDNEIKTKDDAVARHCAYCLQLCGFPAKLCGGCKKRAYCSKECQKADWSINGKGQRHINWCRRHECGEEDVDWEVVTIPNKGLGIRAKKLLSTGMKSIVEPAYTSKNDHPGIMDLKPVGTTLKKKFFNNCFDGDNVSKVGVALRIARVNHACRPNASSIYDETARVSILYATRDIQPGEEITTCHFAPFYHLRPYSLPVGVVLPEFNSIEEEVNYFTQSVHGCTCPSDCFSYDPAILALVREGRHIHSTIMELDNQNKIEEALVAGDKLINIHRRLNVSWAPRGMTFYNLFRIAIRSSVTFPRAKEYLRSAMEIFRNICPYSESLTKKYDKVLERLD